MPPKNLSRQRGLERKKPSRVRKKRFLIYCEGESTERDYFSDLKDEIRGALVELEVDSPSSDPLRLVEAARRRKRNSESDAKRTGDKFLLFDEIWCVFDVDDHKSLDAAKQKAEKLNIRVAISNPCFELWILLHFDDHRSYVTTKDLPAKVRKHLPRYDKNLPDCRSIRKNRTAAYDRARSLESMHDSNQKSGANPSSGVWKLLSSIQSSH